MIKESSELLSGKKQFLLASILLILLSLGYQQWLYPKLLAPVSQPLSLKSIDWQAGFSVNCRFGNGEQQCVLSADKEGSNRFVGSLTGAGVANSVVLYDLAMQINSSADLANSRDYKIVLISEESGVRQWQKPHRFFSFDSWPGSDAEGRLYFQQPVERFQLLVELEGADSALQIKEFSLVQAQETPFNRVMQTVLIILWLLILWIALRCLFKIKSRWNTPLAAMVLLTLIGTQLPNDSFTPLKDWIKQKHVEVQVSTANHIYAPAETGSSKAQIQSSTLSEHNPIIVVKKLAHFGLFALLALFVWLRFKQPQGQLLWGLSFLMVFAVATETLQALGKVRSSSLSDIGIDMAGAVVMLLIIALITKMKRAT